MSSDEKGGETRCCGGICGILLLVGIYVLLCWAILQPHHIRATVGSATLSNLTVVSNNASSAADVSYQLAINLSLYNPSLRVGIYYDTISAALRFQDAVLGPAANGTSPPEFYQRRKTGDDVKLEFDYGRGCVTVGGDVAGELEKEVKSGGPLSLQLDVVLRVRYKLGFSSCGRGRGYGAR